MTTVQLNPGESFTCPAGVTTISRTICGAGGGGAGGGTDTPGMGGEAGQVVGPADVAVVPGTSYPVTGGTYGTGGLPLGQSGTAGGSVTFMEVTATGGAGGSGYTPPGGSGCEGESSGVGSGDAEAVACVGGTGLGSGGSGGTSVALGGARGGHGSTGGVIITYVVLTPSFTPDPASGPAPLDVSLNGTVEGGTASTYNWDYGDGSTHGATQNTTHQYTTVGAKTVTFTVTNDNGSWTATETVTVYWATSSNVYIISTEPWRR